MMEDINALKTAYTKLNYDEFLSTLDGRDDGYWQEQWQTFKTTINGLGKLGTFVPILIAKGKELQS